MCKLVNKASVWTPIFGASMLLIGHAATAGDTKACVECETEVQLWSIPVALKGAAVNITLSNTGKPLNTQPPPEKSGCGIQLYNNPGPLKGNEVKVIQNIGTKIPPGHPGGGLVCLEGGGSISAECDEFGDECKYEYTIQVVNVGKCKSPWD